MTVPKGFYQRQANVLPGVHINEDTGLLPSFAFPGGYPLIYMDSAGDNLCPDCANAVTLVSGLAFLIVRCYAHYEGGPIQCDECSALIESAYGEEPNENID